MRPAPGGCTVRRPTCWNCDGVGLLLMVEGRSSEALGSFAQALREHGGDPAQIQAIAMDMSQPSPCQGRDGTLSSCQDRLRYVPCDASGRSGARDGAPATSARGIRAQRFTLELAWQRMESECRRQKQRRDLCAQYTNLGRAMTLRETLQVIYAIPPKDPLPDRPRIPPRFAR
jgi:hypothetical protein